VRRFTLPHAPHGPDDDDAATTARTGSRELIGISVAVGAVPCLGGHDLRAGSQWPDGRAVSSIETPRTRLCFHLFKTRPTSPVEGSEHGQRRADWIARDADASCLARAVT
jgi:hypothetical protein